MYPNTTTSLSTATAYRGTITTRFGQNGIDGIQFPSSATITDIGFSATSSGTSENGAVQFEVFPASFTPAYVTSYVPTQGAANIFDISLVAPSSVGSATNTSDLLVIEFPVIQNSTYLFAEDLGMNYLDQSVPIVDGIGTNALTCNYIIIQINKIK